MFRSVLVVGAGLVLATSGALGIVRTDDDTAGTSAAVVRGDITSQVEALEAQVRKQPRDGRAWATLGHVYVENARLNGDPTNYVKSKQALATAIALNGSDDDLALAGRAALEAAKHHFRPALREARAALRVNPYQAVALSIQIDALTELGRFAAQQRALDLADRRAPGSSVLTRRSYAYELRGNLPAAGRMLRKALALAMSQTDRAYLLTQIAELDRKAGRVDAAERHLRSAGMADPAYVPAWASRARLELARGDVAAAEAWWLKVAETSPNFDSSLELGEIFQVTGRLEQAAEQFAIAAEIVADEAANGVHGELEVAQLEADFGAPAKALAAARTEWSRRHSVHVADALAWALHRSGRSEEALAYARAATRLGTPEAPMWLHRGLIEAELGQVAAARRHLGYGLQVDGGVRPVLAEEATARLGQL